MYNYYCEKKKKQLEDEQMKTEMREKSYKEKRKKMVNQLYEKYDNRVKGFIMDMVSSPIKVKDYLNPIESTRKDFLQEGEQKIQGRRGMVLKGFKTEKERIEEHMKSVNFYYLDTAPNATKENINNNLSTSRFDINTSRISKGTENKLASSYDNHYILQPEMRYKPRTDLERIFDEINKNSMGRVNRHVIDKQLRELDLNVMKKAGVDNQEEHLEYKPENTSVKMSKMNNFRDLRELEEKEEKAKQEKKAEDKRKKMNSEAKNMMSDLHNKTHFKGATEIANRISNNRYITRSIQNTNNIPLNTLPDEDNLFKVTEENFATEPNLVSIRNEYRKYFNPFDSTKLNDQREMGSTTLKLVHRLAFMEREKKNDDLVKGKNIKFFKNLTKNKNNLHSMMKNHPMHFFKNVVNENPLEDPQKKGEDEKIQIDDQTILRSRVDLIATRVLDKCNYSHKKNKNNNKVLKNGEGKLMMTNGLTINEFEQKYKL